MLETDATQETLAHFVTSARQGDSLVELIDRDRDSLRKQLLTHGALVFRGFDTVDVAAFEAAVRAMSGEPMVYNERSSPRHAIKGNVYTSTDYPADEEIFLHNESSYQAAWPRLLYFYCEREPTSLGATPLADVRKVYQSIDPSVREEFQRRGWMLTRNYKPAVGVPWPEVYGTQNQSEVDRYCADRGIETEWLGPDQLRTRAVRRPSYAHPDTGEDVWFNHITFFHISTHDEEVREGLLAMFGEDGLPLNTYYGDGAPIPDDVVAHLRECYRAQWCRFDWQQGDVLVVENMLTAHAREPYTGPRRIAVAMCEAHVSDYLKVSV
ncbi:TauD/TfdA family dioxygenase [Labedaea rhizosphaerae]|uniref:Alpha-ketoglutarate-dependent taurine dioxygenase n=1 Tax=Labedaea rhizosphaerae TaxID=598644 RepID=A0A4V3CZQ0_LABRH|nr:TauD/TfdA family dioxygenase [Labedaea rhizosphaerae]TDQ00511.1 alpha-ketoglutarate-dependent taurine dioxygenase [Labedaea rhizosphaerae]